MGVSKTQLTSWYICMKDLGKNQRAVYAFIKKYGPISRRELRERMGWSSNCVTSRVTELLKMGMVKEEGTTFDNVTKRNVALLTIVKENEWETANQTTIGDD